jgi:SAM-dependent methyltransferase
MKQTLNQPPRVFQVGRNRHIEISHVADVSLEPDEQITFKTKSDTEYDVVRKDWGYYATPSTNGRLAAHNLNAALVVNTSGKLYVMLVEQGHESDFQAYCDAEKQTLVSWLNTDTAVQKLLDAYGISLEQAESEQAPAEEQWSHNRQIDAYLQARPLKQHEQEMLDLIRADYPTFNGRVLDIGCATGTFMQAMLEFYPDADYTGIELSDALIDAGREKLAGTNIKLLKADAVAYQPDAKYDIMIASGILSVFEDFKPVLDRWLSWMNEGGRLYVFGRFNSREIDTIIRFRNNFNRGDWESGLTSYSVHTIGKYLAQKGVDYEFKRFHLGIDMAAQDNPIRTYTVKTIDGQKWVVNGANIIAEHHFLIVKK